MGWIYKAIYATRAQSIELCKYAAYCAQNSASKGLDLAYPCANFRGDANDDYAE